MKLWDKGTSVNTMVETFTVGNDRELDVYLAQADILGTLAHIEMLNSVGLLSNDELPLLQAELIEIFKNIKKEIYFDKK